MNDLMEKIIKYDDSKYFTIKELDSISEYKK